ncbi:MAG: PucR family transcriptional regulator [Pseudonocardiaceae bacterium]
MRPLRVAAPSEDQRLQETIAGLHAVVMLGSFMHARPDPENTAELAVGGLAALTRLPLAAVAWYSESADGQLQVAVRRGRERGTVSGLSGPLCQLCAQLPDCRPTRLEATQLPRVLRMAGVHVLLALPLRVSTECLGFLLIGGDSGSIPQELTLIQALGAQTSTALYVARLHSREAVRVRELSQLTGVLREQGELLSRALLLQEELIDLVLRGKDARTIVEHLGQQIGAPVWLLDADRRVVAHCSGAREHTVSFPRESELRRVLSGHHPDRDPRSVGLATGNGVHPFLVQSVSTDRETFGYLMVGSTALRSVDRTTFQGGRLVLALRLLIERSVADAEERAGRDLIQDALLHRASGHTVAALASRLGYNDDGAAVVLAVRIRAHGDERDRTESARRRGASLVREALRTSGRGLVGVISKEIVGIVRPEIAQPFARQVLDRLSAAAPELTAWMGISDSRPGLGDLEPAYREALTTLALAERGMPGMLHFSDLGLHRLIFDAEHTDRVEEHVERWIGPLLRYDEVHNTDLVETLGCYLAGAGQRGIARRLSIHPSTLKYRLRRIREILRLDFAHPDARFNIELALRLAQSLRDLQNH